MSYIEKFWRDATGKDVVDVMNGGRVKARVRNHIADNWRDEAFLDGWIRGNWTAMSAYWSQCQVYAPPQWFLDKPEPGEEYRLLGRFPDEPVQGGDFAWFAKSGWVTLNHGCEPDQQEGIWYRRKIEPKPEPKHYVLQVGDTADTGNGFRITITEHGVEIT